MPTGQDEIVLHQMGDLTTPPVDFLTTHYEVDFTGVADEQKVRRDLVALAYLKSDPKIASIINFINPNGDKKYFFSYQNGVWVLTEYAGLQAESGLQLVAGKPRLGGQLLQDTTVDGINTHKFEVVAAKNVTLGTDGGTAKTTLSLGTALSIPTRIRTESIATPTTFGELVIDADGNTEIGQKTATAASGMKMSNAQQAMFYNNDFKLGIKTDGIYAENLPTKTTETDILFVDANGKMSKGAAPTVGGTLPKQFRVQNILVVEYQNGEILTNSSLIPTTTGLNEPVLNGYQLIAFRSLDTDTLNSTATLNLMNTVGDITPITIHDSTVISVIYNNGVAIKSQSVVDTTQIINAINNFVVPTFSETPNILIDTETIKFVSPITDVLKRKFFANVEIPALIASVGNNLGSFNALKIHGSSGRLIVGNVETEPSETIQMNFRKEAQTERTIISGEVYTDRLVSQVANNQIQVLDEVLQNGQIVRQLYVAPLQAAVAMSADAGNMAKLGTDDNIYVSGEQDFKIQENLTSSFFLAGTAVCIEQIKQDPIFHKYDVHGNFDTNSKTLIFSNNSLVASGKSKHIRMSKIQIVVHNTSGILDNGTDFIISLPKEFLKQDAHNQIFINAGSNSMYPTPCIWNIEGNGTKLSPYIKISDANVQVGTWSETIGGVEVYFMRFYGMDITPAFQIQLIF